MTCTNHPDREAAGTCAGCGKPYCRDCLTEMNGRYYCALHAPHMQPEKKSRGNKILIAILAAIAVMIVVPVIRRAWQTVSARANSVAASETTLDDFAVSTLEKICIPAEYDDIWADPAKWADENTYIFITGRIMKEFYSIGERQMLALAQDDDGDKLWYCAYSVSSESNAVSLLPGDYVTVYGQFLEILTLRDSGADLTLPYIAGFHVVFTEPPNDRAAADSPVETSVTLSAPETDPPETAPPETAAPETEAAVVLPLEPEPAETTLEEWFAIVEARVRPRAYEPEEPDPDETTLDEWIEAHRAAAAADKRYTVNTKTKTIHAKDDCYAAKRIKSENVDYVADPYPLLADGYEWCGICH